MAEQSRAMILTVVLDEVVTKQASEGSDILCECGSSRVGHGTWIECFFLQRLRFAEIARPDGGWVR